MNRAFFAGILLLCRVAFALDAPIAPSPADSETNVLVTRMLAWGANATNLVRNGGFEDSRPNGWLTGAGGYVGVGPARAYSGKASAVLASATSPIIFQDIAIPAGASNVRLSWADKLENSAAPSGILNWG